MVGVFRYIVNIISKGIGFMVGKKYYDYIWFYIGVCMEIF